MTNDWLLIVCGFQFSANKIQQNQVPHWSEIVTGNLIDESHVHNIYILSIYWLVFSGNILL